LIVERRADQCDDLRIQHCFEDRSTVKQRRNKGTLAS
jgi:hypothetical protein